MNREEMVALFEQHEDDYGEFENVKDPPSSRPDLCAFILLDRLIPGQTDGIVSAAEHDEIFLDVDLDALAEVVTEENIADLARCGVRCDDEDDCLRMFV